MYYKVTDQNSDLYKRLHALRSKEIELQAENERLIKERVQLEFTNSLGYPAQKFWRLRKYEGFQFSDPEKVDPKVWKEHKEHAGIYVPNLRTKAGKKMEYFLHRELESGYYEDVHHALRLEQIYGQKFSFPFLEIVGDIILVFVDDHYRPEQPELVEITRNEFESLRKKLN